MATTWRQSRRMQRAIVTLCIFLCGAAWAGWTQLHQPAPPTAVKSSSQTASTGQAADALAILPVKGRAPMTGYSRTDFGPGWATVGGCDMREHILGRDLTSAIYRSASDCTVLSGTLRDPYTDKTILFTRGTGTSDAVQIDHVVAIGNAWQTGAQALTPAQRTQLYNDPLELLAVDGPTNEQKGDGDAATWLPPSTAYRCRYVARQVAVKQAYHLWVTQAEHDAIQRVLTSCPSQQLPSVSQ